MTPPARQRLRLIGLSVTSLLVLLLSLGQAGWAQDARAQTVPTLTDTPAAPPSAGPPPSSTPGAPPPGASETLAPPAATAIDTPAPPGATAVATAAAGATQPASATAGTASTPTISADLAACGPGPYSLRASSASLGQALLLSAGGLTLLSPDGLAGPAGTPVPAAVASFLAETIPAAELPAALPGWQLSGCGLRATAADAAGQPIRFLTRGLVACLPAGAASPPARLAYFDAQPRVNRWVFLPIRHTAGPACSTRFHLPGTFALLRPAP